MKCPYNCSHKIVQQIAFDYDEDGKTTMQTLIENQDIKLHECLREECGAWRGGHCLYVGAVN